MDHSISLLPIPSFNFADPDFPGQAALEAAAELVRMAGEQDLTICSCESFTCGQFCSTIGSIPGASAVLRGGLVTYQTPMKTVLAHVSSELIEQYGVISPQCARAMAENTRAIMNADLCVSFTGNAGPSAMENQPAGRIFCAIASKDQILVFGGDLKGDRNTVRTCAVLAMCLQMVRMIEQQK